jgi:hypothetical protein
VYKIWRFILDERDRSEVSDNRELRRIFEGKSSVDKAASLEIS